MGATRVRAEVLVVGLVRAIMQRVGAVVALTAVAVIGWVLPAQAQANANALEGNLNVPHGWTSQPVCVVAHNANLTQVVAQDCGPQGSRFELEGLVPGTIYALRLVSATGVEEPWETYPGEQVWLGNVDHPFDTIFVAIPSAGRWWIDIYFFDDVAKASPFYWEISWMGSAGVSTGYDDGTYRPGVNVSRMAMSAFLYRTVGVEDYTPPATSPFSDVPTSHAFYTEIAWMADAGVSTGYEDGTFRPTDQVSRQAMSAFLFRIGEAPSDAPPATSPFTDVPVTHPFYTEIAWMAEADISTGYADHTYRPTAAVTRLAMSAFLHRLNQVINASE